ncbi:nicotinate phosphoribosyltransferase [Desulfobacterium sp. N47]|uniref:nicotinate phosphoribosyltransferase n=1 Tax=Desulfobacterium sp. N47 TaxID=3115210 RepID=UPI003F4A48EC
MIRELSENIHRKSFKHCHGNSGLALFTDFYELTMMQAYFKENMTEDAVFSLFVRRLPARRNFLISCGLDTVLEYLENICFYDDDIAYLASIGKFSDRFLSSLRDFRFTGDIYAVPEGTPIFANEPLMEVVAPIAQAQIIETLIMNQVHLQTLIASKAYRVVTAAEGRTVLDFGSRRMHGIDAALKAARSFYITGVTATSNVLAGKKYGVPVTGTMAHSYIQAHDDEAGAYQSFVQHYPDTVLLVDTYDTIAGVQKVIDLAKMLGGNFKVKALRLDSGNLYKLSKKVRQMLDTAGLSKVEIFASGGLDEDSIAKLVSSGAPIDGFGVGTSMGVSNDAPDLDIVYKLCLYAGKGRLKLSTGKPVLPGRKQVFRISEGEQDVYDIIACADENYKGRPLLIPVMKNGTRLPESKIDLKTIHNYTNSQIARLPAKIRAIDKTDSPYPVDVSVALSEYQKRVKEQAADKV